jgi:hypothetical protein
LVALRIGVSRSGFSLRASPLRRRRPRGERGRVKLPTDVAVAPDGSFYVAAFDRIRRVDPEGRISTPFISGDCQADSDNEGNGVFNIWALDVAADGAVLFSDGTTIKRLELDGTATCVAGQWDQADDTGEGEDATSSLVRIRAGGDVAA